MNVFEVKATTQAEEQIREIAYHISKGMFLKALRDRPH